MGEKVKRLTKEQFVERVKDLYTRFYNRLENVSFEEFYRDALLEFQKQNKMSDEELKKYRLKAYHDLVGEVNKDLTPEEKKKFEEEDMKTLNPEDFHNASKNK